MTDTMLALTLDSEPGWYGYETGVAHMIMSEVETHGGDHLGGNAGTVRTVHGTALEIARLTERFTGDRKCKTCAKMAEAVLSARLAQINTDAFIAESDARPADTASDTDADSTPTPDADTPWLPRHPDAFFGTGRLAQETPFVIGRDTTGCPADRRKVPGTSEVASHGTMADKNVVVHTDGPSRCPGKVPGRQYGFSLTEAEIAALSWSARRRHFHKITIAQRKAQGAKPPNRKRR